jgi:hypothetical protein
VRCHQTILNYSTHAQEEGGFTTTRSGRHVAFAFSINQLPVRLSLYEEKDGYHHAGELLGEMARAAYLNY